MTAMDPVHFDGGCWWFWDETWADRYGPFEFEQEARDQLDEYTKQL